MLALLKRVTSYYELQLHLMEIFEASTEFQKGRKNATNLPFLYQHQFLQKIVLLIERN